MKRILTISALVAVALLYVVGASLALADGGKGVVVKPLTPKPGDEITVQGDLLGPNGEVEVRVIGNGVDVDLGEVRTDAEGDFTAQLTLPADLKPGTYQLKATGAESVTTELRVVSASGTAGTSMPAQGMLARERPLAETAVLMGLFGVLAGLGLFFAQTGRGEATS